VYALGRHLVARPTAFARFSRGDQANPGAFVWTQPLVIEPAAPRYEGKVVVLLDEVSQSHAEFTAMAFRAAGAFIVGSTTAGADGNMVRFPLPGGLRAAFSGLGAYYPDGRPTQRVGIVPDLVVHPTVEGIRAGRDEVLETALEAVLGRAVQFTPGP
jgi:C-terminal processing protease CtpA/Prc